MPHSILNLFGAVLEPTDDFVTDSVFLKEYGVLIHESATHKIKEIREWLNMRTLNGEQLNASFHKSWEKVANSTDEQLLAQQILHYFSTYGLQVLGVYEKSLVYIPQEELNLPERLPVKVIYAESVKTIIGKCLKMLASGMAMKQETIADIFNALDECGYSFTGKEEVKNREAQVMLIDRLGKFPEDSMLIFRYLVYKATGETLTIKNDSLIEKIKCSGYTLPDLSGYEVSLSGHFNRLKPLWLAFKNANEENKAVVNKISKLSKKHHKSQPINVLMNVANAGITELIEPLKKANTYQLVRAYNSLNNKSAIAKYYRIRNGKGYSTKVEQATEADLTIKQMLLNEIKFRFTTRKIYIPENIDYAIPTSEKQILGNIPYGTKISLPRTDDYFLVGIYWEGENTDLDLKATSFTSEIGWNAAFRSNDLALMFSGDVTSAPNGASEYLYCQAVDQTYLLKVNGYNVETELHPFKLILGYGDHISKNYIIDPNKVIFQSDMNMTQNEVSLGILAPSQLGVDFYISGAGTGEARVGKRSEFTDIAREAIAFQTKNMLRLSDLLDASQPASLSDADIDLSPNNLTKDSFLRLF